MQMLYDNKYLEDFFEKNKKTIFLPGKIRGKCIINKLLNQGEKIIIYGAGRIGGVIGEILKEEKYEVLAFLDKNAENIVEKNGTPCYLPTDPKSVEMKNAIVLISLFLSDQEAESLKEDIKVMGYENVLFDKNLIACFCAYGIKQEKEESLYDQKDAIINAFFMLQDGISREVFIRNLEAYSKWDFSEVSQQADMLQYFDVDVPFSKGYTSFVDCGAYIGDSFMEMIKLHKCNTYIAFEPDFENFDKLAKNAECFKRNTEEILLYPCAVSNKNGYLFFHRDGATGGCLCDEGEEVDMISTVKLDTVLKKKEIGMIKMDVEGAEIDALNGARRIIMEQKPDLAICVYHKISDLWKIPILIKEMSSEYVFYLRCHDSLITETVLYATIK